MMDLKKPRERFDLEVLRKHSRERQDMKTYVILNGYHIGFEVNWRAKTMAWFLFKEKKRLAYKMTEHISWFAGALAIKHLLLSLVYEFYENAGRDRIPVYAEIELSVPAQHFHYLAWSGTLEKALTREVV